MARRVSPRPADTAGRLAAEAEATARRRATGPAVALVATLPLTAAGAAEAGATVATLAWAGPRIATRGAVALPRSTGPTLCAVLAWSTAVIALSSRWASELAWAV